MSLPAAPATCRRPRRGGMSSPAGEGLARTIRGGRRTSADRNGTPRPRPLTSSSSDRKDGVPCCRHLAILPTSTSMPRSWLNYGGGNERHRPTIMDRPVGRRLRRPAGRGHRPLLRGTGVAGTAAICGDGARSACPRNWHCGGRALVPRALVIRLGKYRHFPLKKSRSHRCCEMHASS